MELKINDRYKIMKTDNMGENALFSLFSMYQPIIGYKAVTLYMTLYSEAKMLSFESFHRLSLITNMSIKEIDMERIKLEEMMLIKTYANFDEHKFIFKLSAPLNTSLFLKNEVFSKLLYKALGNEQFAITVTKYFENNSLEGFEDVSAKLTYTREPYLNKVEYKEFKEFNLDKLMENIDFDYEKLLRETSPLVFPIAARTDENLKIIAQIANLSGHSIYDMNILIGKCSDFDKGTLDVELLKNLALSTKVKSKEVTDKYSLSPLAFLQDIQHGVAVTKVDARLLDYLSNKLNLKSEVINVLIEYVLKINDNRLPRNFVEKIAGEWIRDKVDTKEKALEKTKKEYDLGKKKLVLPDYYVEIEENEDLNIGDDNIESLKKRIKGIS